MLSPWAAQFDAIAKKAVELLIKENLTDWDIYKKREPQSLEANIPGIFAVGDVRKGSVKRVASAVGEGSMAVSQIHTYLSEL